METTTCAQRALRRTNGFACAAALLTAFALAPGIALANPAAGAPPEVASATVSLADLDLTTPSGVEAAGKRLAAVASRLCARFRDERKVSDAMTHADCTRDALVQALRQLDPQRLASRTEPHSH